jgi:transcriptional regulator with XRE-family HTH domain
MSNTNKNGIQEIQKIYKIKAKKYTHETIAKSLGISRSYVSLILTGKRKCPSKLQSRLQKYLNQ